MNADESLNVLLYRDEFVDQQLGQFVTAIGESFVLTDDESIYTHSSYFQPAL